MRNPSPGRSWTAARHTALVLGLSLGGPGCVDNACQEYVDYMCDCHQEDADCEELRTTYEDADADLQDQCAIELEDQQALDDEEGLECASDAGA